MSDPKFPSADGKESVDDLWAYAFNEQQATEKPTATTEASLNRWKHLRGWVICRISI